MGTTRSCQDRLGDNVNRLKPTLVTSMSNKSIVKQFYRTDSKQARNGDKSKIGSLFKKQRSIYGDPIFVKKFKNSECDLLELSVSFKLLNEFLIAKWF